MTKIKPFSPQDIELQRRAADTLIQRFGQEEDAAFVHDLVEGQTNLFEAMEAGLSLIDTDQGMIASLDDQIKRLQERKSRLQARVERTKDALFLGLKTLGQNVELPAATLFLTKLPFKVQITDVAALPQGFYDEETKRVPRAAEIKKALQAGQDVPGACAAPEGQTLTIKRS